MRRTPGTSFTKAFPEGNVYIVTEDLSILVPRTAKKLGVEESALKAGLNESFFQDLLHRLEEAIRKCCFPKEEVEVKALQHDSFDDLLKKHDRNARGEFTEFWVCLDNVYPKLEKDEGYPISITRYVDENWDEIDGRFPRPEDEDRSIHEQVAACVRDIERVQRSQERVDPVVIDDGTFDGKTITFVLDEFAKYNKCVDSVRLGVAKLLGLSEISKWKKLDKEGKARGVLFLGGSKFCPPICDWICERDFFPGILYSGKVVGEKIREVPQAKRVGERQIPIRAQYLHGWGDIEGWASLHRGRPHFTYDALGLSVELWERIQALRKKPILVEDLPAIPWKIYSPDPDEMSETLRKSWLEVLREERKTIRKGRWT